MMRQFILFLVLCSMFLAGCAEITPGREQPANIQVLAFTASWCMACQRDKPYLEQLRQTGLKITNIDADRHPELLDRYGVNLLPTYIVLKDGIEIKRTNDIHMIGKRP